MEYFIEKFLAGEPFDVLILQDLFIRVGGCFSPDGADEHAILGRGGGATLRAETAGAIKEKNQSKRPKARLRDVLLNKEIGRPLLVLMARQRMRLLYDSTVNLGMEVTATIYDRCSELLTMMVDFMSSDRDKFLQYAELVPAIGDLFSSYHLGPAEAFAIARPVIRRSLFKGAFEIDNGKSDKGKAVDSKKKSEEIEAAKKNAEELDKILPKWNPYSEAMVSALRQALPDSLWTVMDPTLYTTFWSLSLYDITVPVATYEEAKKKLGPPKNVNVEPYRLGYRDSRDKNRDAVKKDVKEKEYLIEVLDQELEAQKTHFTGVVGLLKEKTLSFFPEGVDFKKWTVCGVLVENLLLPRALLSREDAIYTAHFLHFLHDLETPNFESSRLYNAVFVLVLPRLVTCTKEESYNLGFFVREIFSRLSYWGTSESIYLENRRHKVWLFGFIVSKLLVFIIRMKRSTLCMHRFIELMVTLLFKRVRKFLFLWSLEHCSSQY